MNYKYWIIIFSIAYIIALPKYIAIFGIGLGILWELLIENMIIISWVIVDKDHELIEFD